MAYYADKKRESLKDFQLGLLPALLVLTITMALIIIQPDYSTALMIGLIGIIILFIGGAKTSQLSLSCSGALLVGIPILLSREYRYNRVISWFGSWFGINNHSDIGYQANESLKSLGNGGFFGCKDHYEKNMVQMWDKYYKPPLDVTLGSDLDASLGPDLDTSLETDLDASLGCDLDASLGTDLDVLLGIDSNSEHELGSDDEELFALVDTF